MYTMPNKKANKKYIKFYNFLSNNSEYITATANLQKMYIYKPMYYTEQEFENHMLNMISKYEKNDFIVEFNDSYRGYRCELI